MLSGLFDSVTRGLETALSLYARRHEVLASNLANVETPGYRAREVDFRDALRAAFDSREDVPVGPTLPGSEGLGRGVGVIEDRSTPARADGSTVNLEVQMAKLADNGLRYVIMARLLGRRFSILRRAIDGR